MRNIKTIAVTALVGVALASSSIGGSTVNAQEVPIVKRNVTVKIAPEISDKVSQKVIDQLTKSLPAGATLTIRSVIDAPRSVSPMMFSTYINKVKQVTDWDVVGQAKFVRSVARGSSIKLTSSEVVKLTDQSRVKDTIGVTSSVSATNGVLSASETANASSEMETSLTRELTFTFTTERTYSGPPQTDTLHNSTSYYITPIYNRGTWSIEQYGYFSGNYEGTVYGNYTEPVRYIDWSVDTN
ncbi:hypothetical protein [Paenibacillus hexagrammi]|uniref:Uncharacterized protein n=1 Tax=Paenibacillus hexagrammi TaxID=2908839 RepID=A0ABY3SKQ3_9BACL|nr:hypothetical protein [Paenibacillus sp. YPD9-1]UJF33960.1 hypothetical protein L0M14_01550 [Paenibacillus sp. YPD9-1]